MGVCLCNENTLRSIVVMVTQLYGCSKTYPNTWAMLWVAVDLSPFFLHFETKSHCVTKAGL